MNSKIFPAIITPCKFLGWSYDPSDGQLKSNNDSNRLQPRISKLLSIFVANYNRLLTRDDLIEILWQDKAINEDALSRCVAELRAALGDNRTTPIYIETLPKKGYRFLQPVKLLNESNKLVKASFKTLAITILIAALLSVVYFNYLNPTQDLANTIRTALISAKRVTADHILEYQPQVSKNGNSIAFSFYEETRYVVKLVDQAGKQLYKIVDPEHHLHSPTFSNDGKQILIAGLNKKECNIYMYQLPTLTRETLGSCYHPNLSGIFDWSADNKSIAYINADKLKKAVIWLYDLETKKHTQLTSINVADQFDSAVKFSPNGEYLAFTRGTTSARDIYQIQFKSPEIVERLTFDNNTIASFTWLNDNRHILYDSDELGDRGLWLLNTKTKNYHLLGAKDAQYPSASLNGKIIAFQELRYNAIIWSVDLSQASAKAEKLIEAIKYNNHPEFSPNDKLISFTSNREGKSGIWIYSIDTKTQRKLISLNNFNVFMSSWSSDNNRLLVSTRSKDGYHCFHVNLADGKHQQLSTTNQQYYGCRYSKDNQIFALAKATNKPIQLVKLGANEQRTILLEEAISKFQISDSNTIIYSLENKNGLYSVDFDGQNRKVVIADFDFRFEGNWTVRGQSIYFTRKNQQTAIWKIDLKTNKEQLITTELPSAIGMTMSVNSAQSQLLLSRTESRKADIYITHIKP